MKQLNKKGIMKRVPLIVLSLLLMMIGVSSQNGTTETGMQKGSRYDAQIRK